MLTEGRIISEQEMYDAAVMSLSCTLDYVVVKTDEGIYTADVTKRGSWKTLKNGDVVFKEAWQMRRQDFTFEEDLGTWMMEDDGCGPFEIRVNSEDKLISKKISKEARKHVQSDSDNR